jgi:hypothetical protein
MRPQDHGSVRPTTAATPRALLRRRTLVHKIALLVGWPVSVPGDRVRAAVAPRLDAEMRAVAPEWRGR